jgi:hypothetical protein
MYRDDRPFGLDVLTMRILDVGTQIRRALGQRNAQQ